MSILSAFFLKKSTLKGRSYLSIVESYYSPQKHGGAHRTYKSLASVETWKAKGIDDPIAYFQKEVDELNKNNKNKNSLKISDHYPELYLGYFPIISMMNKQRGHFMKIKKFFIFLFLQLHVFFCITGCSNNDSKKESKKPVFRSYHYIF